MKKTFLLLLFPFFLHSQSPAQKDSTTEVKSSVAGRTKEEALEFAESLREKIITKTAGFGTLAALYSEDPGSAKQRGELAPFGRGRMVREFEEMAFSLQVGEISKVFETQYGYHFLEVMARDGELVVARHILIRWK